MSPEQEREYSHPSRGEEWDFRFLMLAKTISSWSKDPSTQFGAVIVDQFSRVVSLGYNGFAAGVLDDEERYADREKKYEMVIHAEANAILHAKGIPANSSLYSYPFPPCSRCAGLIINSGVSRIVSLYPCPERWVESVTLGLEQFQEAGVARRLYKAETFQKWLASKTMVPATVSKCC